MCEENESGSHPEWFIVNGGENDQCSPPLMGLVLKARDVARLLGWAHMALIGLPWAVRLIPTS